MEDILPEFSRSTQIEHVATSITVMDVLQSYFSYRMCTMCGYPRIMMEGTLDDWRRLRVGAKALLAKRCTAEFAAKWSKSLIPILDKFVEEYEKGAAGKRGDDKFWNS